MLKTGAVTAWLPQRRNFVDLLMERRSIRALNACWNLIKIENGGRYLIIHRFPFNINVNITIAAKIKKPPRSSKKVARCKLYGIVAA